MKITRPRHHVVAAYLALFISLSGTAYAANTIRSDDIVDGEVKAADVGTFPHIVTGDNGADQFFTPGQDAAVRFGAANTSRSSIVKQPTNTRFLVNVPGLYEVTSHVRIWSKGSCRVTSPTTGAHCATYAIAKLVRYANGGNNATTLASDQGRWVNDKDAGTYIQHFDLTPTVIAKFNAGDEVSVLVAADWVDGDVIARQAKVPTETASLQPLFTMNFISK